MTSLLRRELSHVYVYHNLSHTQRIVKYTKELIENENVNENDAENLLIAAWFHDTGFIEGADNHEEKSAEIASKFLKEQTIPIERIKEISNIILATKA